MAGDAHGAYMIPSGAAEGAATLGAQVKALPGATAFRRAAARANRFVGSGKTSAAGVFTPQCWDPLDRLSRMGSSRVISAVQCAVAARPILSPQALAATFGDVATPSQR